MPRGPWVQGPGTPPVLLNILARVRSLALLLAFSLAAPAPSTAAALARARPGRVTRDLPARFSVPRAALRGALLAPIRLAPARPGAARSSPSPVAPPGPAASAAARAAGPASRLSAERAPAAAARPVSALSALASAAASASGRRAGGEGAEAGRQRAARDFDGLAPGSDAEPASGAFAPAARPLAAPSGRARAPNSTPPSFTSRPGMAALNRTHFLGVFNDTALKLLFVTWITGAVGGDLANLYIGAATAAYTLPFVLLSSYAGPLSDRVENARLFRGLKVAEVGLVGAAAALFAVAVAWGPGPGVLSGLVGVLGLVGVHGVFLGPVKKRMIGKLAPPAELGAAMGRYNLYAYAGTALGMMAGTLLVSLTGSPTASSLALLAVAGLGLWSSRGLAPVGPTAPGRGAESRELGRYLRGLRSTLAADWRAVRERRPVRLLVGGIAAFSMVAVMAQMNIPGFVAGTLGLGGLWLSAFLGTFVAGVALGSLLAERLQAKRVKLELAAWGAGAMAALFATLSLLGGVAPAGAFAAALGLGAALGLFTVPLNAQLLLAAPAEERGRYLGAAHMFIYAAMAAGAGLFALVPASNMLLGAAGEGWRLGPEGVFAALALGSAALALKVGFSLRGMRGDERLRAAGPAPALRLPPGHPGAGLWERGFRAVYRTLASNLVETGGGRLYARPAPRYPGIYLWDSAFIAEAWRPWDPAMSRDIVRSVLRYQRPSGRISQLRNVLGTSPLTNPPVLSWAALRAGDDAFLAEVYGGLARHHAWLNASRRLPDGLYFWAHPYESGIDNSPRFSNRTESRTEDTRQIAAVDLSSYMALDAESLAAIARRLGREEEARVYDAEAAAIRAAINARLWDEETGHYLDRRLDGRFIRFDTVSSLTPLVAGVATSERAERLVRRIMSPEGYGTLIPVPTVARSDPSFEKDMWRGPVWINMAYLVVLGLERYGRHEEARELSRRLVDGVYRTWEREGELFEFYDPERTDITELTRKKGNWFKQLTLGRKPVRHFAGWTALVNNLAVEQLGLPVERAARPVPPSTAAK